MNLNLYKIFKWDYSTLVEVKGTKTILYLTKDDALDSLDSIINSDNYSYTMNLVPVELKDATDQLHDIYAIVNISVGDTDFYKATYDKD